MRWPGKVLNADRRRLYWARGAYPAYALRAGHEVREPRVAPKQGLWDVLDACHFRSRFGRFQGFAAPFPSALANATVVRVETVGTLGRSSRMSIP